MTVTANTRAAPPGNDDKWALTKAALAAGVSGCAMGVSQAGAVNSSLLPAGAAVAAVFAFYWMLAAIHVLPPIAQLLALPSPAKAAPARLQAARSKPAGAERAAPTGSQPQSPIDGERARLRALGYSDVEISKILVEQAAGNGAARGNAFGSGVATGLLNNVGAMLHYFSEHLPSFKSDFERMFDEDATKAVRASGAASLALKAAAIGIAGYFLWIESIAFRGHALEEWGKGCLAAQDNAIKHATLNQLLAGGHLAGDDCDQRPL